MGTVFYYDWIFHLHFHFYFLPVFCPALCHVLELIGMELQGSWSAFYLKLKCLLKPFMVLTMVKFQSILFLLHNWIHSLSEYTPFEPVYTWYLDDLLNRISRRERRHIPVYIWCFNPSLLSDFDHFPGFFEGRV